MAYNGLMKEFSVTLANQPGQLATLARRLSDAGVHIESMAAIRTFWARSFTMSFRAGIAGS